MKTFVKSLLNQTAQGDNTSSLTERQVERLEELHNKHFAG